MSDPQRIVPDESSDSAAPASNVKLGGIALSGVVVGTQPDPQQILRDLLRSRRGKHKIYVGAAPGVGKTYRALQELRERQMTGEDVMIGYLEAHGRQEVKDLALGLEVFPRRVLEFKGKNFKELDLEGLIARKPTLVLVDELQHTNAPGSKHKKRFVDVDELLNAGINVVSTMNIQHLEGLNDIVTQMTGIRVKERVPDRVLLDADEVVLVDVSTEQLQDRLKAGKIVAPENIQTALSSFFTEDTLAHLRELALRQFADAVEEAPPAEEMLARGSKERIAVAITAEPEAARLIRRAARIAQRLKGEMHVVYVKVRSSNDDMRHELKTHEQLTQELDGEFHILENSNVVDALVSFTRQFDITQIVMGESHRSRWQEFITGSVIHEVMRRTHDVDVYVIADNR
jgi:two-component system, OmpR family, sensor histidine kinase KdpD